MRNESNEQGSDAGLGDNATQTTCASTTHVDRKRYPLRPFRVDGDVAYLLLTQGHEAVVDAEDIGKLSLFNWQAQVHKYPDGRVRCVRACRSTYSNGALTLLYLHRVVLGAPPGVVVDHINGNTLDNRKINLREATPKENSRNARKRVDNSSGYKGVSFNKHTQSWQARIRVDGCLKYLGVYETAEEGYEAYCKAALKYHGEFCNVGTEQESD